MYFSIYLIFHFSDMEEVKKEQIDTEDPLKLPLEKHVKKEIFEPSTANTPDEIVICEPKIEETYSENENEDFFDEEEDFPLKKRYKSHKIKPKNKDGIYICEETGCMYQTTVRRNLRRHNLARHRWFSVGICKYKPGYKSHDLL